MNFSASIIDLQLSGIMDKIREKARAVLGIVEDTKLRSVAFVYLCVKTVLPLDDDEAFDCLTEGSGDFDIDAIHVVWGADGELFVTLFHGKYSNELEGTSNFDGSAIDNMINALRHIFDPSTKLEHINPRLLFKVESVRSLIRDGVVPQVRAVACNNGLKWNAAAQEAIDRAGFGPQVAWEHVNHETLLELLQKTKPINTFLHLSGPAMSEDFSFCHV